jgi:hypothetical protein
VSDSLRGRRPVVPPNETWAALLHSFELAASVPASPPRFNALCLLEELLGILDGLHPGCGSEECVGVIQRVADWRARWEGRNE